MKKTLSLLLALALLLSAAPAALAEDGGRLEQPVTPTPPDWVAAEDYLTFPGDPVYAPTQWAAVLELRRAAEEGALLPEEDRDWVEGSPGWCYETALVRLRYAANAGEDDLAVGLALRAAGRAFSAAENGWYDVNRGRDERCYRLALEKYRAFLAYRHDFIDDWGWSLVPVMDALDIRLPEFYDAPFMDRVDEQTRARVAAEVEAYWGLYLPQKSMVSVYLDGHVLLMDTLPQVADQRTMVPIRAISEALGADVSWDEETWQVTLRRAGTTVTLMPGEKTAQVNGEPIEMDVAPYADQNRTYVPVRYVSQFFGQRVDWDQENRRVKITEDKTPAEGSNIEAWALPMGSLLMLLQGGDPARFGGWDRGARPNANQSSVIDPVAICREALAGEQGLPDREALLTAAEEILAGGHNAQFMDSARLTREVSQRDMERLLAQMSVVDKYMWPQTKALALKWGEKGILAWDMCRLAALAQWGYTAGYLSYTEALTLTGRAAGVLRGSFGSWEEVYENFLEGYYWCIREDMSGKTVWDTELGQAYQALRGTVELAHIFDDTLFETGVFSLPLE